VGGFFPLLHTSSRPGTVFIPPPAYEIPCHADGWKKQSESNITTEIYFLGAAKKKMSNWQQEISAASEVGIIVMNSFQEHI
jgi:hypothetical protein